jgi:hypothetical protein
MEGHQMWLPTPVYERLPQFFFLLGLLFIANGLYLGFDFGIAFAYVGFGLWCSAYGIGIFVLRGIRRSSQNDSNAGQKTAVPNAELVSE